MAPTRRSTRAKSTDPGVAGPSPSTRATKTRPATKTNPPVAKPRAKPTRKTTAKAQIVPEDEEEEEEEEEEVEEEAQEEKQKPKAKNTRKGAAKAQPVPAVEKEKEKEKEEEEEEEEEEIVSQKDIEDLVATATRSSNRATTIASLQSPAKSKAARGRIAKKVAPARKIRGAAVGSEVVPDADTEDPATPTRRSRGRKPLIEAANSPAPTAPAESVEVVVIGRSQRRDAKQSKNLIGEPVVAESSADASATPSWAKKRGGRKTKVIEDVETADDDVNQHTGVEGVETEVVKVDDAGDIKLKDTEPKPVAAKGKATRRGKKADAVPKEPEAIIEDTAVGAAEPEPVAKRGATRRGKKADIVPEAIVEDTVLVAEPEPTSKGRATKRGKKADVVAEEPEAIVEDTTVDIAEPEPVLKGRGGRRGKKTDTVADKPEAIAENTSIDVAEPETAPKGRATRRGKKADVIPEAVVEDTVLVAKPEPTSKGRAIKKGRKAEVAEEPEAIVEDALLVVTGPEPASKGRATRRGKKADAVPEDTEVGAVDPEPVVAKGRGRGKGKKVVEDTGAVAEEPESVVEEPEPVLARGGGRKRGKKVGAVVEEPEPVVEDAGVEATEPTGRRSGRRVVKAVGDTKATAEEPEAIVEETKVEVAEPERALAKGRGHKRGKQAIRDVEITDTKVDQQTAAETEAAVEKVDTVEDIEPAAQEPLIDVRDTEVEVAEEPAVESKGRRGKKVAPAKKDPRKGRKFVAELPDVEMSDTDFQTQQTEVDVEAEPIANTIPTVKDSGIFLENEPIVKESGVDKPEPIAEESNVAAVLESIVVAGARFEVATQGPAAEEEPVLTMQSSVTVAVAVESGVGQTKAITEETDVEAAESSKASVGGTPGSSRRKISKDKGKAKIVAPVEAAEMEEPSVEGEKPGSNIELESTVGKPLANIEMPKLDIGVESEGVARTPKSRKKAKRSTVSLKRERQAKAAAKKAKAGLGSATGDAIEVIAEVQSIVSDSVFDGIPPENIEKKEAEKLIEEDEDEEDEPDLPQPFSSPVAKPTIILSPRRATPDPDLDPIKTPVPSSPIDRRMSHPLTSSPLRHNGPDTVVLASPRQVTTPSNSPSKKRSTPSTRTPINRLPGSGIPFGRNLEDSRDVVSTTTPARGRSVTVASSPIMMPPATPNVVAGDARSPTKQTPTKESEIVRDAILDRVDEPSLFVGTRNINSSPVKNSTPIRGPFEAEGSSPVGRLSFGGSDISQSSPLVGRLQISEPSLLLSSPLAVPSKTFSPTKTQHSSPTRSSPLKHSPLAMGSSGFFGDEMMGGSSFMSFDGDYSRIDEPDDDEEGEVDYQDQGTFEYGEGEEVEEKNDQQPEILPTDDEDEDDNVDFDATIDESRLFKLADRAMLEGDAQVEQVEEREVEEEGEETEEEIEVVAETPNRKILASRISDFEVSCLEQVHPEFGQAETHAQTVPEEGANSDGGEGSDTEVEEEPVENNDVAEGDLTFSDVVEGDDSIPSSPVLGINSPIKFDYRPTNEIFPSGEFAEVGASQEEPFSPIDMDFFSNRSFDTSAADWREDGEENEEEEEEEEEEDEETEPDANSPGGRLRHFRASSPPNIWPADEGPGNESVGSGASPGPKASMPWDESDFDFSEEFIQPPSSSPEPGDERNFDFSGSQLPPGSPTPGESVANNAEEVSSSPAAEGQASSTATKDIPSTGFQAGGTTVQPIAKVRTLKAVTNAWLGMKGLQPKEKPSAPEKSVNGGNEDEAGDEEAEAEAEGEGEGEEGKEEEEEEEAERDDATEMKGGKRLHSTKVDVGRVKRVRGDTGDAPELPQVPGFLLEHKSGAGVGMTVEKGRRQTFGGKPIARPTGPSKRRKSFPEGPTIPDRQSYLYASDPERILRHWAQHEKDQAAPEPITPSSPLLSVAASPMVASSSGDASLKRPVWPSPTPTRPRRIRSVRGAAASPSVASGPPSSPPSAGGAKRKAVESLETERASKSSIPVSRRLARRPPNSKTQEEVELVLKNTAHNALYSCKLDYEPVQKSGKRPPSLDNNGVQRLAAEARRRRKEAEELGLMLRPGEDEAFVAVDEQGGNKGVRWDGQLEYSCGSDPSEKPHARSVPLPNKSILTVKPRLNIHGNWVPVPGVPPLRIPEELVVVKKVVYIGEGEEEGKKGRK